MKKVCVITGTRAEYGLLKPLLHKIKISKQLELQLIATAMHLSPDFGMTIQEITKDGFEIDKRIECLLASDTAVGVSKSMGLAQISMAEAFEELSPDAVIILGDRSEILAAASAAMIANIPIAHIHGGETTEGAYDEAIRHAVTKMSYWHFTSTETYRQRVIQLGEHPNRVFNVGAIGLDSIKELNLLSKKEFEAAIDFKLNRKTVLVTYHPVTLESQSAEEEFNKILNALDKIEDLNMIFTHANSDKGGRIINQMIKAYVQKNSHKSVEFKSLGQLRYLSALKHIDAVVGNSSSGILEVPYFNIPSIDIGDRQKGRVAPLSVIHTNTDTEAIYKSVKKALSDQFMDEISNQKQIYGEGQASGKIIKVLTDTNPINLKKKFYDLNSN
ncbi:UDP-N-acetylglucosamine 2-epimerase [Psychroflexus aestuariivivens]|uniref:UDP-N-acetylglucosamine 2-epimerase n=1 Tax=Psychroflexus aestuariivivens TaxID=1795040 RepID=UPI000FD9FB4A|nr:UDP-N-acetylglucosamine 2-epimerase [Psychroflexus aestuariivivens]